MTSRLNLFTLAFLGLTMLSSGWSLVDYSCRPGNKGDLANQLNSIPGIQSLPGKDKSRSQTLLIFYHPHCPCTHATAVNLRTTLETSSVSLKTYAFAYCPQNVSESWISSPLTSAFKDGIGATIVVDRAGEISAHCGAKTSGHLLAYDDQGSLLFSGGVTSSRGHEGNCRPSSNLLQVITSGASDTRHWPVYGCSLVPSKEQR